jgi:fructokinase
MSVEGRMVVGLGELIWDLLPAGRQLGGAPTNFAYVSRLLGAEAAVASRVGRDALGDEAVERLSRAGVETRYLQRDDAHPTGTVGVEVDARGEAHFSVNENSAWDYLEWDEGWEELAARGDAVCFGTLGQRHERSRSTVLSFLRRMRPGALRVFDVNLRHSFFDAGMLAASLELTSVLKLNVEELPRLASMLGVEGRDEASIARRLIARFPLSLVAITRGARGGVLISGDEVSEHDGYSVEVVDTIGAGDAFAAGLVHELLRGATLQQANETANLAGAWVASRAGATPPAEPGTLRETLMRIKNG